MIFASLEHVLQSIPLAVVNGRGGRNQHDRFYQELLNEARRLQTHYRIMQRNAEKRRVQLQLIGWVEVQGGAFVKRNATEEGIPDATTKTKNEKQQHSAAITRDY